METCVLEELSHMADFKTLVIMNNKGGVGKSTLTDAMAHWLVRKGYKVLIIDNDPQHNITQNAATFDDTLFYSNRIDNFIINLQSKNFINNLKKYLVYLDTSKMMDGCETGGGKLGIIAGIGNLESAVEYSVKVLGEKLLIERFKAAINHYKKYFDFILIDTAPSINNLTNNITIAVADTVIIPFDGSEAIVGLDQFVHWVQRRDFDKKPNALFVLTKYQRDTFDMLREYRKVPELLKPYNIESGNVSYRILKTLLGDFVCDHGIPERMILKNHTYMGLEKGYDVTKKYNLLMTEIFNKNKLNKTNIFDFWIEEDVTTKINDFLKPMELIKNKRRQVKFGNFNLR